MSADISQISDAPGLDCVVNLFLYLGGIRKIGCEFFLYLLIFIRIFYTTPAFPSVNITQKK